MTLGFCKQIKHLSGQVNERFFCAFGLLVNIEPISYSQVESELSRGGDSAGWQIHSRTSYETHNKLLISSTVSSGRSE